MSPGPEEVARAVFAALEERRWLDAARHVHPAVLARSLAGTRETIRAAAEEPEVSPMTADDFLRHEPEMPREVAEYQARRMAEGSRAHGRLVLERAGVASLAELEALSPEEAFARFLACQDKRNAVRHAVAGQGGDPATQELMARTLPRTARRVVGAMPAPGAGDERAFVVYSAEWRSPVSPAPEFVRTGVVGMRRDGAAWKLDPGDPEMHELFGGGNFSIFMDGHGEAGDVAEAVRRSVAWPAEGTPRLRARMEGAGDDPLRSPPTALVLERLASDGTVLDEVEIPAEAWESLNEVVSLWSLLVVEPGEPA